MSTITRVAVAEARERLLAGDALLVCAYESDEKFQSHHLDGAVSFSEFQSKISDLAKDKELIFYCA